MKRRELADKIRRTLNGVYDEREVASITFALAERLFGLNRLQMVAEPDADVDGSDENVLDDALKRLASKEPLQYVLGVAEFCGMEFGVAPGVLIPRPETEELVMWIVADMGGSDKNNLRILDIGTGSGAIAVALAANLRQTAMGTEHCVMAVDLSAEALAVAGANAVRSGVAVNFVQADALAPTDRFKAALSCGGFDVIVSNPPYIPRREQSAMNENVTAYEPHLALFVEDDDPFVFYRAIGGHAVELLTEGGTLYFEIHENYADDICRLLEELGFAEVECRTDINSKPRMIKCRKR